METKQYIGGNYERINIIREQNNKLVNWTVTMLGDVVINTQRQFISKEDRDRLIRKQFSNSKYNIQGGINHV